MTMSKVIIFGGNFRNKGAEALTYSLINLLKVKHPDAEPVLLDLFPSKYGDAKNDYPFTIVNMHVRTLLRLQFGWLKLLSAYGQERQREGHQAPFCRSRSILRY